MDTVSYSVVMADFAKTMTKVCNNHAPIIITKRNEKSVIMMSLEDYEAIQETSYLLRSPANARILLESIAELEAARTQTKSSEQ